MKMKTHLLWVLAIMLSSMAFGQQAGKMVQLNIDAPSMANSILGEPTSQPLAIYLPPSYESEPEKHYPVVYFLPGYEDTIAAYTKGYINGYFFEKSMNSMITQRGMKEAIMVIVNGYNRLTGCFYNNSPVTGNWEDFVVNEAVSYIDSHYRTLPTRDSRAIFGLSMGGYGATHLSMKHPDVFSIGVGECPGLANPTGIMRTSLFLDANVIKRVISIRNELAKYPREEAHKKYLDTINYYKKTDWVTVFSFAYGSAFAPDTTMNAPYCSYPFSYNENNELVMDSAVFKRYEQGFGNLKAKVEQYRENLLKLKGYGIDYGTSDYFRWIIDGNIYYDSLLTAKGIPHRLWKNSGGHGDQHRLRTENVLLPYIDSLLTYDTPHLSNKATVEKLSCTGQAAEPVFDYTSNTIIITFKADTKLTSLKPSVFVSPGASIFPAAGVGIDLSGGSATYTITSEDGSITSVWTIKSNVTNGTGSNILPKEKLKIIPNPVYSNFSLSVNGRTINKVEIIDAMGKSLLSKTTNAKNVELERSNIPKGNYFVKVYTDGFCHIEKITMK